MSDSAFLTAMVDVENAWLTALVDTGTAPAAARCDLTAAVSAADVDAIARRAEADGNPAIGLVALLRDRTGGETARWLHRGLTSQDVVDTALMLCLRDVLSRIGDELTAQVRTLVGLTEAHQHSPMLTRTLTQAALPGTVGAKTANWLTGVLDAADAVAALPPLTVQTGGAAGTHAAATELTGSPGRRARPVRCVRVGRRPRGGPAVAHDAVDDHQNRRCHGRLLRRMGAHRERRRDRQQDRDRRACRGQRG